MLQSQNPYITSGYNMPYQQSFVPGNLNQNLWSGRAAHSYRFQPMNSGAANFNNLSGIQNYQPLSTSFTPSVNAFNPAINGFNQGFHYNPSSQAFTGGNTTGIENWNTGRTSFGIAQPSIDVSETKDDVILACDLPNVNLNDLNLTVGENSCSISAQTWVNGRSVAMHRTVPLSTSIRSDAVGADYSNGILQVRMPKKDVHAKEEINVNFK